jgi:cobalt-zinc-cadmium efflux system protein
MIADAASSIGIVAAAFIIMATGFVVLDPIVSIGISIVILYWAGGILRESVRILLEMAPKGMDIDKIAEDLKTSFPDIFEIYDAHLWTIIPDILIYSAHIELKIDEIQGNQEELIFKINDFLSKNYKIIESTIQIVPKGSVKACSI